MRVVLDTNLWLAGLLSASMRERISKILANERIEIIANIELLGELEEVCSRPKFSSLLTPELVADFLIILHNRLIIIDTWSIVKVCRDPNDDFLLAICQDGEVNYLLTGDKDLLSLGSFNNTRMLTLTEFEQL